MWYLIVSIPDICILLYVIFHDRFINSTIDLFVLCVPVPILLCNSFYLFKFYNHLAEEKKAGLEVIIFFSCSTQLSTKFEQLIKLKYRQLKKLFAKSLRCCIYHADKC